MIEAQKQYSAKKVAYAKEVVDVMVENGEAVTPYSVMKKSKLAKSFIYTNEEVKAYIERFRSEKQYNPRKYTEQDAAMERIEFLEKENWALRKELKAYKKESVEALLTQTSHIDYDYAP